MTHGRTRRFRNNLRIERDNAALYARLAELADDPQLQHAYRRIAAGERGNAQFWEARLRELGEAVPRQRIGLRVRALSWFARRFGTEFVMPTVVRLAHADHEATPVDRSGHRDHFPLPRPAGPHGLRHRAQSGNTLRAAVLGANDGLVSNVSLVMGMAGAATGDRAVLLAGLAGLVAGSCSMALGEWLSVNSSREFYQAQITERAERLAVAPEEGREHIAGIYRDKGLEPAAAEHLAEHVTEDRKSTRLNSSHPSISYAVFCLKKKKKHTTTNPSKNNEDQPNFPSNHDPSTPDPLPDLARLSAPQHAYLPH